MAFLGVNHHIRSPQKLSNDPRKRMPLAQRSEKRLLTINPMNPLKTQTLKSRPGRQNPFSTRRPIRGNNVRNFTIVEGIRGRVTNQKDVFRRLLFDTVNQENFSATVLTFFESRNLTPLNMQKLSTAAQKMQKKFVKLVIQHRDDLISDRQFENMKQSVNVLQQKAVDNDLQDINIGCFVIVDANTFFSIELNASGDSNFEATGVSTKPISHNIHVLSPMNEDVIRIGDKRLIETLKQHGNREVSIASEPGMFVVIRSDE